MFDLKEEGRKRERECKSVRERVREREERERGKEKKEVRIIKEGGVKRRTKMDQKNEKNKQKNATATALRG